MRHAPNTGIMWTLSVRSILLWVTALTLSVTSYALPSSVNLLSVNFDNNNNNTKEELSASSMVSSYKTFNVDIDDIPPMAIQLERRSPLKKTPSWLRWFVDFLEREWRKEKSADANDENNVHGHEPTNHHHRFQHHPQPPSIVLSSTFVQEPSLPLYQLEPVVRNANGEFVLGVTADDRLHLLTACKNHRHRKSTMIDQQLRDMLQLQQMLGRGSFGVVYHGIPIGQHVGGGGCIVGSTHERGPGAAANNKRKYRGSSTAREDKEEEQDR